MKKENDLKPKYNMAQNSWYMIKLAWTKCEKNVIVLTVLYALFSVAQNLLNLYVSPMILSVIERQAGVTELIWTIAAFALALMFVSAALSYIGENIPYGRVTMRSLIGAMRNDKTTTTSYPNLFDEKYKKFEEKSGEIISSPWGAPETIWSTFTSLMTSILGISCYAYLMSSVQPVLILVILVTAAASYFITVHFNETGYRCREEEAEYVKRMEYFTVSVRDLELAKDIRIFGMQGWLKELYAKAEKCFIDFQLKVEGIYLWAKIADLILTFLRNAIVYTYLIYCVLDGELHAAEFLLLFSATNGFAGWVSGIIDGFKTLHRQSLDISTCREFIEFKEPFLLEGGVPLRFDAGRMYEIRLENVCFRYPGADKDTLHNINLTLKPGEKLAVVGLNGAGKTTLIKLICGLLDPTQGSVLLDETDIRTYNRVDYYAMFSSVFQDFSLLADTIAVNVAQEIAADKEEVEKCVEKAGLRKKLKSLQNGCETYLNRDVYEDAVLLSGGETQRLMLARALYKNAPFLLLDEPTAALDPIAESELYQKYNTMTAGKSAIYISHRLASTRFCDRIILIADGGIAEEGTHSELLKMGGKYAELFEIQSKYYKEGVSADEEDRK